MSSKIVVSTLGLLQTSWDARLEERVDASGLSVLVLHTPGATSISSTFSNLVVTFCPSLRTCGVFSVRSPGWPAGWPHAPCGEGLKFPNAVRMLQQEYESTHVERRNAIASTKLRNFHSRRKLEPGEVSTGPLDRSRAYF